MDRAALVAQIQNRIAEMKAEREQADHGSTDRTWCNGALTTLRDVLSLLTAEPERPEPMRRQAGSGWDMLNDCPIPAEPERRAPEGQ